MEYPPEIVNTGEESRRPCEHWKTKKARSAVIMVIIVACMPYLLHKNISLINQVKGLQVNGVT